MDTEKEVWQKTAQEETLDAELLGSQSKIVESITKINCCETESVTFAPCDDFEERTLNIGNLPDQVRF
ncbi:hypothetical protein [Desulfoscipio gibsoniae]|uniref:Uncharacterized protein n=1 Tax=Desulfoscipio gibsoniae DSM 7213 TaxID=767817 RepID=R4KN93_9FIRM|nr:hypothetical protein [Desulfoscipio gibsoniae]AGL01096.1 hypothetical protein Desgi_1620 [Desulfoscipio gibsoniae DSM 7213]